MNTLLRSALIPILLLLAGPVWAQKTTEPQPMAAPGESTEPPRPNAAPVPIVQQHALPRAGGVLVFGGTDGTRRELTKVLIANHIHVTVVADVSASASTDTSSGESELTTMGAVVAHGNALDPESIKPIFASAPFRAVISAIDEKHNASQDLNGFKDVVDGVKASNIPRLILISAIGAGDSSDAPPWYVKVAMKLLDYRAVTEVAEAEDYLRKSGLEYTIVRSGGPSDQTASGKAVLTQDNHLYSRIARADLANLLAACVDDDTLVGKTLSAFDETRVGFLAMFGRN